MVEQEDIFFSWCRHMKIHLNISLVGFKVKSGPRVLLFGAGIKPKSLSDLLDLFKGIPYQKFYC